MLGADAPIILGIESSCDDTSAALLRGRRLLANCVCNQSVHVAYGGVVPELASRAHLSNIVPVVSRALADAQIEVEAVDAIAFTRGPGLLGPLLVGVSFAKALALARKIPLVEVNHLQGHILSPFIESGQASRHPQFPYLSLLVSGGHTQIVKVDAPTRMEVLSNTIDDAAGEAFDKCAKVLGLPYPGGPHIDRLAKEGNPQAFPLAHPLRNSAEFSFSGLKTSFLYLLQAERAKEPRFIERNLADLAASLQAKIIEILLAKCRMHLLKTGIRQLTVGGGVAANSGLRNALLELGDELGVEVFLPALEFTTDNAAMIAIAGLFMLEAGHTSDQLVCADPRLRV